MRPQDFHAGVGRQHLLDGCLVDVALHEEIACLRQLGDAPHGGRVDVLGTQVQLADTAVDVSLVEPLFDVRRDGRVARPRVHVLAGAIRTQERHDAGR